MLSGRTDLHPGLKEVSEATKSHGLKVREKKVHKTQTRKIIIRASQQRPKFRTGPEFGYWNEYTQNVKSTNL